MAGLGKRIFEYSGYHPYLWLRFLDDIFCIWTDGLEKLQELFKFLNAFHPTIKFTMDYLYETIISWMSKYLKGIQHLKQTCTVKTQIGISTCMQNHVTDMSTKSIYHLAKQYG